ncbi:MAG: bifunctional 4-hydroxy-2-oxoglutarate aldolase/2-dehydro-3-deoxy-phosphogluconate aldolase [Niallia nealsonii]|uniref:Bifunctional 4-hydroxy-2-oxoglutarate aldolase/2-dehydro-3-deoxy-phosphogluconate aldolase n=1 Tax=Niallia circulans TaxID=1397 RepID=A0A941GQ79_NIACI|nr:bifunctional 4-hydroxy-2-oxoglutarate aldolase/2-dehydro-3-deoxy-phosphogluconate aldolase [Niallia circulans]MCB5238653.1 bifunctional 4-hydroxy-2-oxoglutarate aldolase/2-dehydro-3-deoxy-phosphogluconate aldolase [Niallia circulans]MDU1847509.1 bifunctional 4-hydroxy-2-oxoglutarate aldolase/2-dehydro-3-deoxy-phosphogluconate aldolase [Niallia nealsonii]
MSTLQKILEHKLIAIIRGANPEDTLKIVKSLYEGGIKVVEITMNSPKALTAIERVVDEFGDKMAVGAGTVLDAESARSALLAGAQFILSPTYKEETIRMTKRYGAVSIPAAFTPTEILEAYECGGDIIKIFPATILGPKFIKDIHGPLPQIPLLPTGGVDLNNVKEYLVAGAAGLGIGSSLVNTKKEISEEYLLELTEKSNKFTLLAQNY